MTTILKLILLTLAAFTAHAQVVVNGGIVIQGLVDASAATSTKPMKGGTTPPATCSVGMMFFDTDATAGANLLACTNTDVWTVVSGGAVASVTGTANEITVTGTTTPVISLPSAINLSTKTVRLPNSDTLPGSCSAGETYIDNNATTGQRFYACESGVFVLQGGSGGGGLRAAWALCLGVPCVVGADQTNWLLITDTVAISTCSVAAKSAPVGTSLSFDVLRNGSTSIYGGSTKPTLATTVTGPSAFAISSPVTLSAGDYLTVSITSTGTTVPGLDVSLVCTGS